MTLSNNDFITRAGIVHNSKYDYSRVEYKTIEKQVKIICYIHGEFLQRARDHLSGNGCQECGRLLQIKTSSKTKEDFVGQATEIHGNKYDYRLVNYTGATRRVKIICKTHGEFLQSPSRHLNSTGCQECAQISGANKKTKTTEDFIKEAKLVHNSKYDYSIVNYKGYNKKIKIICPVHGQVLQTPENHIKGCGCPKCSGSNISRKELLWLTSVQVPDTTKNRQVSISVNKKQYKVDGYIPETNTVYEFWGDFWHGNLNRFKSGDINPKNKLSFGELFNITRQKRKNIIDAGYNLIEVWESEWDSRQKGIMENT